jgi:deoxyribonucleoside regulator
MQILDSERIQLINVAKMYYEANMTQNDIAKRLGVSRPLVSKMLTKARDCGIVSITVNDNVMDDTNAVLLQDLCQKFQLDGGLIIPDTLDFHTILRKTAIYLGMESQSEYNVGLGWGAPLGYVVKEMSNNAFKQSLGTVSPLIGRPPVANEHYAINEMVKSMAQSLGRRSYSIEEKAFAVSSEDKMAAENKAAYMAMLLKWRELDMAVIAVQNYPSSPDEATEMRFGDVLRRQHAVGSFLSYFYNVQGDVISGENDFTCRISLADLRHCHRVYAIGYGAQIESIMGALRTGIFTQVLLMEKQAKEILKRTK